MHVDILLICCQVVIYIQIVCQFYKYYNCKTINKLFLSRILGQPLHLNYGSLPKLILRIYLYINVKILYVYYSYFNFIVFIAYNICICFYLISNNYTLLYLFIAYYNILVKNMVLSVISFYLNNQFTNQVFFKLFTIWCYAGTVLILKNGQYL